MALADHLMSGVTNERVTGGVTIEGGNPRPVTGDGDGDGTATVYEDGLSTGGSAPDGTIEVPTDGNPAIVADAVLPVGAPTSDYRATTTIQSMASANGTEYTVRVYLTVSPTPRTLVGEQTVKTDDPTLLTASFTTEAFGQLSAGDVLDIECERTTGSGVVTFSAASLQLEPITHVSAG